MRCLIVDTMHESIFSLLQEIQWEYDYQPTITRDEIKTIHRGYDGLIIRSKTHVDRDLLGENPTFKFIARAGAGIDNLDVSYLQEKRIAILHASEGNRDAVAEYALGALLSVMRHIPRANAEVREKVWLREENRGEEIMGKTVGIIGYGNMGSSFARRLSGFGCNVLAYDKYKTDYADAFCKAASMDDLFRESDVLSLHIPLTAETRGMVNTSFLNRFQKSIILINTARGEILPLHEIASAVESKKVRAAVLDVLENEKLHTLSEQQAQAFYVLKQKSNVILTPHIAGWTFESHVKINVALVDKIKALSLAL
ncbi:NAD(P)-dependent oxidoreductase [Pseudochryseolinea flava]|uniref:Phosphoglycerate dehydrogenase n=1 Tax=Pseudochryseolinea flava TaxID=2059302 RepID=A0A364Y6F1_9BACT|nr:NAD(P)-dependent oxidoreductase [Pseudochryseolinea flava]RAW01678.1 phosphoglycerate dehydrogenase [Pseudochryseolinea flava]